MSAREISNAPSDVDGSGIKYERGLSAFIYVWGQFIDHDLDLTQSDENGEAFDIVVPTGDPLFDPVGDGQSVIPLTRSAIDPATCL